MIFSRLTSNITLSLATLVMVAIGPLVIFAFGVGWLLVDQKEQAIEDRLASTANALQVAVDRELLSQSSALRLVANADDISCRDIGKFSEAAKKFLSAHPSWRSLTAIDPLSYQVVAATLPLPSPRPTTLARDAVDQIKTTGEPAIAGTFPIGKLNPAPLLMVLAPVVRDANICLVLAAAMDYRPLSAVFRDGRLPESWTGAVIDSHSLIAGRSRDAERFVGSRTPLSLTAGMSKTTSGMFTSTNFDGQSVYTVFSRSPATGFSVAIGVPAAEVEGPVRRLLMEISAGGAGLILVGLALTGLIGRRIITTRTDYEQTILDRERRLSALATELQIILDTTPFAIFKIVDRKQEWVSRKAEELFQYAKEEMLGQTTRMFYFNDNDYDEFAKGAYATLERGGEYETVVKLRRRDGAARWIRYCGKAMDPANPAKGTIWLLEDLTDHRETEAKIVAANRLLKDQARRLEAANAELEQFAYVTSHDLRQPLRMVVSYLALIEKQLGGSLSPDLKTYFAFASDGAKRMDHMVQDLLAYSRIGRTEAAPQPVALSEVVADSLLNLSVAINEAGARITVAEGLPTLPGDHSELVRLFQNLIGNAIKYRHAERAPVIDIGHRRDEGGWVIWVADNGMGIAADQRERAFAIFQRLVPKDAYEGTGIGLAICKKIVERLDGRIWIEDAPGGGSVFLVFLPDRLSE